ncbi:MAG: AI-2E family transporter [Candidatus Pacebacteria bacterium]|nr:AI-2E family transporter [Candidatus Paceibacterota bacterium]
MAATTHKLQLYFFTLLVIGVSLLTFFILRPYLLVLFLAAVITVAFYPVHKWILRFVKERKSLAASISVFLIILLILTPFIFFGTLLFQEAVDLYVTLQDGERGSGIIVSLTEKLTHSLDSLSFIDADTVRNIDINTYFERGLLWVVDNFAPVFTSILRSFFILFFLIFALFYCLRDGEKFIEKIIALSPLPDIHDKNIISRLQLAVNSVINGYLLIAIIKGVLTGVGFALFGFSHPVLWGFAGMILAILPIVGAPLVFIPALISLFLAGKFLVFTGLLIWTVGIVGLIDNVLAPFVIERGVHIHPFLILISILGGLETLGPIGFIAGPVILSLLFTLLEVYSLIVKKQKI